jgi:hypothetical protein
MRGGEGLPVYTTCEQEQEIYQIQNINQIKLALVASGTKVQTAPQFHASSLPEHNRGSLSELGEATWRTREEEK